MYMDSVILFSLLIIGLTCAIVIYSGIYTLKHVRKDIAAIEDEMLREKLKQNDGDQQPTGSKQISSE